MHLKSTRQPLLTLSWTSPTTRCSKRTSSTSSSTEPFSEHWCTSLYPNVFHLPPCPSVTCMPECPPSLFHPSLWWHPRQPVSFGSKVPPSLPPFLFGLTRNRILTLIFPLVGLPWRCPCPMSSVCGLLRTLTTFTGHCLGHPPCLCLLIVGVCPFPPPSPLSRLLAGRHILRHLHSRSLLGFGCVPQSGSPKWPHLPTIGPLTLTPSVPLLCTSLGISPGCPCRQQKAAKPSHKPNR